MFEDRYPVTDKMFYDDIEFDCPVCGRETDHTLIKGTTTIEYDTAMNIVLRARYLCCGCGLERCYRDTYIPTIDTMTDKEE